MLAGLQTRCLTSLVKAWIKMQFSLSLLKSLFFLFLMLFCPCLHLGDKALCYVLLRKSSWCAYVYDCSGPNGSKYFAFTSSIPRTPQHPEYNLFGAHFLKQGQFGQVFLSHFHVQWHVHASFFLSLRMIPPKKNKTNFISHFRACTFVSVTTTKNSPYITRFYSTFQVNTSQG